MQMKRTLLSIAVATALSAGALAPMSMARAADVSVQFNAGNVAFGFSDGYWDRDRTWHAWPSTAARTSWRAHNRSHYSTRRHDHSPGWGWNDSNRYWEHH